MDSKIRIRLSDGYSWAEEFDATGVNSLRAGCLSAWVAYHCHLNGLADAIPPYQTIKREKQNSINDHYRRIGLQVHVKDPALETYWVNSGYCDEPFQTDNDWSKIWDRVMGSYDHINQINSFCDSMSEFVADTAKPVKQKLTIINGGKHGR